MLNVLDSDDSDVEVFVSDLLLIGSSDDVSSLIVIPIETLDSSTVLLLIYSQSFGTNSYGIVGIDNCEFHLELPQSVVPLPG